MQKGEDSLKSPANLSVREVEEALGLEPCAEFIRACEQDPRVSIQRLLARHYKHREAQIAEQLRIERLLSEEKRLWEQGYLFIAGIDEAGRGPLAGPVVAAACILPARFTLPGLNDSKKLTEHKRDTLFTEIKKQAIDFAVGSAEPAEIDVLNILQATKLAMRRAVEGLRTRPNYLIIDAVELNTISIPQLPLINGDNLSASVAAASILAKVTRDNLMAQLHSLYPEYGFDKNKGYGTQEHVQVLRRLGPCPIHRRSFTPVEASAG